MQGNVVEAADVVGEEVDVGGELLDAVGVDAADGGRQGQREDGFCSVRDGVEEHEFFDLGGERQQDGGHDITKILGQGLDVGGWFGWRAWRREVVLGCLDKVVDLGIHELKDALFGRLFVVAEGGGGG